MEKWVVIAKKADFQENSKKFKIDPVIARIIRNREVVEEEEISYYLYGNVTQMHDPKRMKDMEKTVDILQKKIEEGKKIRIIGDYDIDGIQSSYILFQGLKSCNAVVDLAIPDRILDGYGLNQRLIQEAYEQGVDTILTCDNGIAAREEIRKGKELGMTILVTDHHEVPYEDTEEGRMEILPCADAIVNPKQADCKYPFKSLCGAAVAYKVIQALFQKIGKEKEEVYQFLPYAAFATVGDIMELQGENRILVKEGLKRMETMENQGLLALMMQNKLLPKEIKAYHIGFILGPCLNASGRLDTAVRAIELLLAEDVKQASEIAKDLIDLNASRKELTKQGVEQADRLALEALERGDKVFVLYLPQCHESLAGIIAGRIREKYHHPVFILTKAEEGAKGSGRSIEAYSMYEEMCKVKELFTKFGGHPMAAGLSLPEENVSLLRERINQVCQLTEEDFTPKIMIDVPMPIDYITKELVQQMSVLEPFGKGNEKPVFADKELAIQSIKILGKFQNLCKMQVESKYGTKMDALYFGEIPKFLGYLEEKFGKEKVELLFQGKTEGERCEMSFVYYPDINYFGGRESLQIVVQHYR